MADNWYYELNGDTTGPISFRRLAELIEADDAVEKAAFRNGEVGTWISARSVAHVLQGGLLMEEGADEERAAEDELSSDELHELARLCADLMSVHHQTDADAGRAEHAASADTSTAEGVEQWYCRVLDTELGPMPLDDLRSLARQGGLSLEDAVRLGSQGAWVVARAVEELLPEIRALDAALVGEHGDSSSETSSKFQAELPDADAQPDIILGDDDPQESDTSSILSIINTGAAVVARVGLARLGSEERSRQFREELAQFVADHAPDDMTLDVDGVKSLPGPILKSLADLSRDGTRVVLVNFSEQIREDVEFAQLDRLIEFAAGHSIVGD